MKATIRDVDVLKAINPLQVATYLQAKGWHEQSRISDKASIWLQEAETGDEFEILLPLNPNLRDFSIRMSEVLQTLEVVEHRSQLDILADLTTSLSDIIQIRVDYPNVRDGSIPIYDCLKLLESTKTMMLSAACSTIEPKAYFQGRKFDQAVEYIEKVRVGQTERGSYIFNIISPISQIYDAYEEGVTSKSLSEPFERQVTKTLVQALSAILTASQQVTFTNNLEALIASVQEGVSANLCQALLDMSNSSGGQGLRFYTRWSPTLRKPANIPEEILLPTEAMPRIKEVSHELKTRKSLSKRKNSPRQLVLEELLDERLIENSQREAQSQFTIPSLLRIMGSVVRLEWVGGNEPAKATIISFVDDEQREIVIELSSTDYITAFRANLEQRPVICYGTLIRENHLLVLKEPQFFAVAQER